MKVSLALAAAALDRCHMLPIVQWSGGTCAKPAQWVPVVVVPSPGRRVSAVFCSLVLFMAAGRRSNRQGAMTTHLGQGAGAHLYPSAVCLCDPNLITVVVVGVIVVRSVRNGTKRFSGTMLQLPKHSRLLSAQRLDESLVMGTRDLGL
jgi:hypothetical protein